MEGKRMDDKNRLQEMKNTVFKQIDEYLSQGEICDYIVIEVEDVNWLIEQAEKVEQLEMRVIQKDASIQHLNNTLSEKEGLINYWKQISKEKEKQLHQVKEILKDIEESSTDIFALRKARQALEVIKSSL